MPCKKVTPPKNLRAQYLHNLSNWQAKGHIVRSCSFGLFMRKVGGPLMLLCAWDNLYNLRQSKVKSEPITKKTCQIYAVLLMWLIKFMKRCGMSLMQMNMKQEMFSHDLITPSWD